MTGTSMPRSFIARSTAKPSVLGISRSRITQSIVSRERISSASSPDPAIITSNWPRRWRSYAYWSASARLSSVTRTVVMRRSSSCERDLDAGAFAGRGLDSQTRGQVSHEAPDDRQAESGPLERVRELLLGHATSRIGNGETPVVGRADRQRSPGAHRGDGVRYQILDDTAYDDGIRGDRWHGGVQHEVQRHAIGHDDRARNGIDVDALGLRAWRQARIVSGERVEISHAGIQRRASLGVDRREGAGVIARDLVEVSQHVSQRRQAIFYVMRHLPRQIADGRASLGFFEAHGTRSEPLD